MSLCRRPSFFHRSPNLFRSKTAPVWLDLVSVPFWSDSLLANFCWRKNERWLVCFFFKWKEVSSTEVFLLSFLSTVFDDFTNDRPTICFGCSIFAWFVAVTYRLLPTGLQLWYIIFIYVDFIDLALWISNLRSETQSTLTRVGKIQFIYDWWSG